MQVIEKCEEQFMYWGPLFTDYSPITEQKAMANVSWLSLLFLNYSEPLTRFTQVLRSKGENVLLYLIRQAAESVSYGEPLDIKAIVSPTRIDEIFIEPGYLINDYINVYVFAPLRHHDKIRWKGEDYEVLGVQPFDFAGQTAYFKSACRRLIG